MKPSLHVEVSVEDQQLRLVRGRTVVRRFPVSTSGRGIGFESGSHRTPTGSFVVSEMIGADCAPGTVFVARQPVGRWSPGQPTARDLVLTRILRLDGVEARNANTRDRCIYIHGTNQEERLGTPAGIGCVRMSNHAVTELFSAVEPGTTVEILPPARSDMRLLLLIACREALGSDARPTREFAALRDAAAAGWTPVLLGDLDPDRMRRFAEAAGTRHCEQLEPRAGPVVDNLAGHPSVARWLDVCHPKRAAIVVLTRRGACAPRVHAPQRHGHLADLVHSITRRGTRQKTITLHVTSLTSHIYDSPVMSNAKKGKRYTEQEKSEILAFVAEVNKKNKRGGQKAASEKFGISPLTISSWLKKSKKKPAAAAAVAAAAPAAAVKVAKKAARKAAKKAVRRKVAKKVAKKAAKKAVRRRVARKIARRKIATKVAAGGFAGKLARLAELHAQITAAEANLAKLKASFATLKGAL